MMTLKIIVFIISIIINLWWTDILLRQKTWGKKILATLISILLFIPAIILGVMIEDFFNF